MQIFKEVIFFKLRTTKKLKNKHLMQLISCQLDVGGWQKEKGMRLTDVIKKNNREYWFQLGISGAKWQSTQLLIKKLQAQIPTGAIGKILSPELTLCTDSCLVSIPPQGYHSGKKRPQSFGQKFKWHGVFSSPVTTCFAIYSLPALFFFKVESGDKFMPLLRPGSVHSGSAWSDNCGQVFPDKLHVSSFLDRFPYYAWTVA